MCSNPLPPLARRPGTVGIPHGTHMAIWTEGVGVHTQRDIEGEILTAGENVIAGYALPSDGPDPNPGAFITDAKTGRKWFRTGDWGLFPTQEEGYLVLKARVKELINRAGEKIAPAEVEWVLVRHPGVAEAVCFGVPDAVLGEVVGAMIVLKPPSTSTATISASSSIGEDDIRKYCAQHLAAFKVPVHMRIVTDIPKTATGKVQRRHLTQRVVDELRSRGGVGDGATGAMPGNKKAKL